jgi:hypothetical protein
LYQPEPFKTNALALTFFWASEPLHCGQGGVGALIFTSFSNSAPQLGHRYS